MFELINYGSSGLFMFESTVILSSQPVSLSFHFMKLWKQTDRDLDLIENDNPHWTLDRLPHFVKVTLYHNEYFSMSVCPSTLWESLVKFPICDFMLMRRGIRVSTPSSEPGAVKSSTTKQRKEKENLVCWRTLEHMNMELVFEQSALDFYVIKWLCQKR